MTGLYSYDGDLAEGPSPKEGSSRLLKRNESGNVLFYIFLAVGLVGALTFAVTKGSKENYASQNAVHVTEELFAQANIIRSAIQQCVQEFPSGGGDMDASGAINTTDNPNNPYPLNPSSALNAMAVAGCTTLNDPPGCTSAAADNKVKYLTCPGAPLAGVSMFQSTNNQGRFLPPPPSGFSEWTYKNDAAGVYIQTTAPANATAIAALQRLFPKFNSCGYDMNYGACGATCFTLWIQRNSCNITAWADDVSAWADVAIDDEMN